MTLILELPPELEERLEQEAARNGLPVPEYALTLLTKQLGRPTETDGSVDGGVRAQRLWEVAAGIMRGIPEDELDRMPADLSENLDHYLYGAPKKQA